MASVSETPPRAWKDQWRDELVWTGTSSPDGDAPRAIHAAIVGHGLRRYTVIAGIILVELVVSFLLGSAG